MNKRGKGPRDVLVPKYGRWIKGKRKRVVTHKRGADPIPSLKKSDRQLSFDFDPPGTAR